MPAIDKRYGDANTSRAPSSAGLPPPALAGPGPSDDFGASDDRGAGGVRKRDAPHATAIVSSKRPMHTQSHPAVLREAMNARTVVVPRTPPLTPPNTISPYSRRAASGVTLSFRKAKNVATINVLKRSPKR